MRSSPPPAAPAAAAVAAAGPPSDRPPGTTLQTERPTPPAPTAATARDLSAHTPMMARRVRHGEMRRYLESYAGIHA